MDKLWIIIERSLVDGLGNLCYIVKHKFLVLSMLFQVHNARLDDLLADFFRVLLGPDQVHHGHVESGWGLAVPES